MTAHSSKKNRFIEVFSFKEDASKPGRMLATAKIGDVYMSRLVIDKGVVTGNYFHKKTRVMFYCANGNVLARFEHVKTHEKKEIALTRGKQVIHVPPYVALATKNVGRGKATLVFFSDRPLRSGDSYPYEIHP